MVHKQITKGAESVVFIPATPNSELKKRIESKIIDKSFNLKIVEKGGQTIKSILTRQKQKPKNPEDQ